MRKVRSMCSSNARIEPEVIKQKTTPTQSVASSATTTEAYDDQGAILSKRQQIIVRLHRQLRDYEETSDDYTAIARRIVKLRHLDLIDTMR